MRGRSGNVDVVPLGEFNPPENQRAETITYYKSYGMDIYNAVLNHPAMEADGVTFEFLFYVQVKYSPGGARASGYSVLFKI